MPVKLLRQIVTLLIVTAYIGATSLQAVPSFAAAAAMNHEAIGGMMHDQDNPDDNMPCKGMLPGCVSDLGCIFLVSLRAPRPRARRRDGMVIRQLRQRIARIARAHDQARSRTSHPVCLTGAGRRWRRTPVLSLLSFSFRCRLRVMRRRGC